MKTAESVPAITTNDSPGTLPIPIKRTVTRTTPSTGGAQTEKGNEIWLLTLSDLLMLLMIFFVVLFSLTLQKQLLAGQSHRTDGTIAAIAQASETTAETVTPPSASAPPEKEMSATLEQDLTAALNADLNQQGLLITRTADVMTLTFPEKIMFDPGQARLKPSSEGILTKVALFIKSHTELVVEVQGYTDDTPISSARYPSNWELSVDRATQVARDLIAGGVNPEAISVKGFGEYHPLVPNRTPEERQLNRRVEIQFSILPLPSGQKA